jgi:hypothetical protein
VEPPPLNAAAAAAARVTAVAVAGDAAAADAVRDSLSGTLPRATGGPAALGSTQPLGSSPR